MQVEHLTVFVFIKTGENIKDTLVGRLAKQQRTNNIKQRSVEIQISVRLALVALTACQLTPYGPIALVIHSTWCVVCHCIAVFIFSQQTQPNPCTNICILFYSVIFGLLDRLRIYSFCVLKTVKYNSRRAHVKKDA